MKFRMILKKYLKVQLKSDIIPLKFGGTQLGFIVYWP